MVREKVPLLISLSSNRDTGALDRLARFPVEVLDKAGVDLIPSTDDPRCSRTTLSIETLKLQLLRESALKERLKILAQKDSDVARTLSERLELTDPQDADALPQLEQHNAFLKKHPPVFARTA
jgi:hypothetical protein